MPLEDFLLAIKINKLQQNDTSDLIIYYSEKNSVK